jgi:hypothetical protein
MYLNFKLSAEARLLSKAAPLLLSGDECVGSEVLYWGESLPPLGPQDRPGEFESLDRRRLSTSVA